MNTTTESNKGLLPVTRWQALRERLALVWDKAAAWWAVQNRRRPMAFIVSVVLVVLGLSVWAWVSGWRDAPAQETALLPGRALQADDAILMDFDQRLLALERLAAAQQVGVGYVAPVAPSLPRRASTPAQQDQPMPRSAEVGESEGEAGGYTELDQKIDEFTRRLYQQEPTK
jgi:hypothetical protein